MNKTGEISDLVQKASYHYTSFSPYYGYLETPDKSTFVLVKPNKAYLVNNLLVGLDLFDPTLKESLLIGNYALRIYFLTFPLSADYDVLRKKWNSIGYLWTEDLAANDVKFEIMKPKPEDFVDCKGLPNNTSLIGQLN